MTVKEVIEELKKHHEDTEILFKYGEYTSDIDYIEIERIEKAGKGEIDVLTISIMY